MRAAGLGTLVPAEFAPEEALGDRAVLIGTARMAASWQCESPMMEQATTGSYRNRCHGVGRERSASQPGHRVVRGRVKTTYADPRRLSSARWRNVTRWSVLARVACWVALSGAYRRPVCDSRWRSPSRLRRRPATVHRATRADRMSPPSLVGSSRSESAPSPAAGASPLLRGSNLPPASCGMLPRTASYVSDMHTREQTRNGLPSAKPPSPSAKALAAPPIRRNRRPSLPRTPAAPALGTGRCREILQGERTGIKEGRFTQLAILGNA